MSPLKLKIFIFSSMSLFLIFFIGVSFYFIKIESGTKPETNFLILFPSSFKELPGWQQDDQSQALQAFIRSCSKISQQDSKKPFSNNPIFETYANWKAICQAATQLKKPDAQTARNFFQQWFRPYLVTNNTNVTGLFTGYYLPLLQGSLKPHAGYEVPIYARPKDLVNVNLGLFNSALQGFIKGQVHDGRLLPYPDRAAIEKGEIKNTAPVLVWVKNPIKFFFMQIQGSGLIAISHNKKILLSYADSNGHPYVGIGKVLIARGALTYDELSMKNIINWLESHPKEINPILNNNPSFVFFRLVKSKDPIGAEQVPLTAQRSLAVDPHYIPLGDPVWLNTTLPRTAHTDIFQHLVIAQDTGGAIKGVIRGDVYWGTGQYAEDVASDMKSSGSYWVLVPKLKMSS